MAPHASSFEPPPRRTSVTSALGLFAISAAILSVEVLQTRLFAYSLDALLFYAAVSVALLGLGASGSALSLWQGWRKRSVTSLAALFSAGFAISLVAVHVVFARFSSELSLGFNLGAVAFFAVLAIPYLFGGAAVTVCLAQEGAGIHRTYFFNLLGSAAGCFVVFVALEPLGAPTLLCLIAVLAVVAALLFALGGASKRSLSACACAAVVSTATLFAPDACFPFSPDPTGQLVHLRKIAAEIEDVEEELVFDAWDPTGRIEVFRYTNTPAQLPDPVPFLFYAQDGTAGSVVLGVGDDLSRARGFFERTLYGAAYNLRAPESTRRVLIIGLGGGPDVQTALHYGAESITALEINASSIRAMRGPLASFAGDPYARSKVEVVQIDGRSYVHADRGSYDLLVLTGADTKSVLAAGSLAISENHLYTLEAFGDYLDRLAPGGHVALLRFTAFARLRMVSIGIAALRARGVSRPERHIAVLEQAPWTSVIIGRDPITPDERARLRSWVASIPSPDSGIRVPAFDLMGFTLSKAPVIRYPCEKLEDIPESAALLDAASRDDEQAFIDEHRLNIAPTTDDRPFFFDYQRTDTILSDLAPYYRLLGTLLGIMALLALVAIAVPPILRRQARSGGALFRTGIYFTCLGFGFMLLEIGFVQRLVVFLGHQSYAITVVLATLLVTAGLGSAAAGSLFRPEARVLRRRVLPAILVAGGVLLLALDYLAPLAVQSSIEARIGLCALFLAPLGFVLGMPFPTGLAAVSARAPGQVPWAIGANSFASVLGASAALPAAMLCGYRALIFGGFAVYVCAAIAFPPSTK